MRRPFLWPLILLTVLVLAAGAVLLFRPPAQPPVATADAAAVAQVRRVSVEELRGQLATSSPPIVWDFRPTSSFAEGHVPSSHVLTLDKIPEAAASLDRRLPIVTVCA